MVGFSTYFHVNEGHPVLKHPLYLKYNIRTLEYIKTNMDTEISNDLKTIMATNENMAIIWYLRNVMIAAGV